MAKATKPVMKSGPVFKPGKSGKVSKPMSKSGPVYKTGKKY